MEADDSRVRRARNGSGWRAPAAAAAVFLALLLIFAGLAVAVSDGGHVGADRPVMMWVHGATSPWLTAAAETASFFGGWLVLVASFVVALVCCLRRRLGGAFLVLASVYGASRGNAALKSAFERTRPDFWEHLSVETTYSFPSGHAMGSMSIAAPLVVLAWGTRFRWPVLAVAAVYVGAVGASRVYLGVHFPSDVLAGWCVAVLWVGVLVVLLLVVGRWATAHAPRLAAWF